VLFANLALEVRGRAIVRYGVVALVAVAAASPQPVAASGTGPGQGAGGVPETVTAGVQFNHPQRSSATITGMAAAPVYIPSGTPGRTYGSTVRRPDLPLPPAGTACQLVVYEPDTFQVNGNGAVTQFSSTPYGGPGSYTYPTGQGNWMGKMIAGMAAQSNLSDPFLGIGKYDTQGNCVVPPVSQQGNGPGWAAGCAFPFQNQPQLDPFIDLTFVSSRLCIHQAPNPVFIDPADPVVMNQLRADIGTLRGLIDAGTIASMPQLAGLVNTQTCFWILPPANPIRNAFNSATYDLVIHGNPDGTNRVVYYTFRISLATPTLTWDWGDNTSGVVDDGQASPCNGQHPNAVARWGHVYKQYKNPYQVSVTEHYGMTIDEFWFDPQAGQVVQAALTPAALGIPPLDLVAGPYAQPVVQEMGVPTA
jgi:hypothetical protein